MATTSTKNLYIGIDGGASSAKLILIDSNEQILSKFASGSCNKNNIGFEAASKNVFEGIDGLLTLSKRSKKEIAGICMTTAGCTMVSDKNEWQDAIRKFLNNDKNALIEVYNDSVGDVASVCPKKMKGIVCIVGTGFIVCGYNGDPNIEYRAGGWGPLFGDPASAYFMGEKVLKAAALYYDITGDAHKRFITKKKNDDNDKKKNDDNDEEEEKKQNDLNKLMNEYGASAVLYKTVMEKGGVKTFPEMVKWAYESSDKYKQVAQLAMIALDNYESCKVSKKIIDDAISALILRILLILNKMHPISTFFDSKQIDPINIICGGSIMLKSNLFLNILQKQLMWKLGGDGRQTYIQFLKPKRDPQLGGALYIKHKHSLSSK